MNLVGVLLLSVGIPVSYVAVALRTAKKILLRWARSGYPVGAFSRPQPRTTSDRLNRIWCAFFVGLVWPVYLPLKGFISYMTSDIIAYNKIVAQRQTDLDNWCEQAKDASLSGAERQMAQEIVDQMVESGDALKKLTW